jgi:hypothetical protein
MVDLGFRLRDRCMIEVGTSLPRLVEGKPGINDLYQALLHQPAWLKVDQ